MKSQPNPIEVTLNNGQSVKYGRDELISWKQVFRDPKIEGGTHLYVTTRRSGEIHYKPSEWERVTVINDGVYS